MIRISDFKKSDSSIDWDAYNAAEKEERQDEINEGKRCSDCGKYIVFSIGRPTLCAACKRLKHDNDSVTHERFIRCPSCRETMEVEDLYEEGAHDVYCNSCDAEFTVITHISFSFESPAIKIDDGEDE